MAEETVINTSETEQPSSTPATETPTPEVEAPKPAVETPTEKIDLGSKEEIEPKPDDKDDGEVDARYGAPAEGETYDIKLEGEQTIDADAMAMVDPLLRELNLSNDAATKLVGTFAEKVLPHYEQMFTKQIESSIVTQRTEWEGAARDLIAGKGADGAELVAENAAGDVLGFDGKDIKGVQAVAQRAITRLAPAGFHEWLTDVGLGVHPQMVTFAYQVGKAIAEDGTFETSTTAPKAPSREQKYYG